MSRDGAAAVQSMPPRRLTADGVFKIQGGLPIERLPRTGLGELMRLRVHFRVVVLYIEY